MSSHPPGGRSPRLPSLALALLAPLAGCQLPGALAPSSTPGTPMGVAAPSLVALSPLAPGGAPGTAAPPASTLGAPAVAPTGGAPALDSSAPGATGACGGSVGLVGDSITVAPAWKAALEAVCPGTTFTNSPRAYAYVGKTTRQMRADLDAVLAGGHDTLVVLGGVNNNWEPARVIEDLGDIHARARARGIRVVAVTVMPYKGYSSWTPTGGENVRRIDEWIRSRPAAGQVDAVADAFALFSDPADPDAARPGWTSDRLHPNATGYQALAGLVATSLRAPR